MDFVYDHIVQKDLLFEVYMFLELTLNQIKAIILWIVNARFT